MKITILLLIAVLLSGCGAPLPEPLPTPKEQLKIDFKNLQSEHETLLLNYGALKKANEELKGNQAKCNELITANANLQTQYAILESYYEILREQYGDLINQFSEKYAGDSEIITEFYKQNVKLIERQRELNQSIEEVHSKNVPLLSENLTETEYNAFYKGWKLWWGTFNEKDEEENGE